MIKGFFIGEEKHVAILSIIFGVYKLRFHRFYPATVSGNEKQPGGLLPVWIRVDVSVSQQVSGRPVCASRALQTGK